MLDKYIEVDGELVLEPNLHKWATWYETADRKVARTKVTKGVEVSTVFLSLDHAFGGGPPILYETIVFGGPLDKQMERYSTREEALEGHARWVAKAKAAVIPEPLLHKFKLGRK